MIYITGPGHGGPGLVANAYLEGTYSEVYPNITPDEEGMKTALHSVLLSGGHSKPRRAGDQGSMHEGGELGYALSHAYGAAFEILTLLSPVSSAMVRPKLDHWRQAGIPTSS